MHRRLIRSDKTGSLHKVTWGYYMQPLRKEVHKVTNKRANLEATSIMEKYNLRKKTKPFDPKKLRITLKGHKQNLFY